MLTALNIAVRTLLWSLGALALALVVVMVRLDSGPISLDWLKPRIERALTPGNGTVGVVTDAIELRLNKEARTLELVGVDVRYHALAQGDAPARPFLTFPEVGIALSVEALLKKGMIAASEVAAKAPSLIVTRSESGVIGLHSEAEDDGGVDDMDFGGFLRDFVFMPNTDDRLAFLERLQIGGGRVAFYDRAHASALTAKNADLVLTRRDGGVDGWIRADIAQPSLAPAAVQLSGRIEQGAEQVTFEADIADLMPADLPTLWPGLASNAGDAAGFPLALAGLRLPVRASIVGEIGLDGALSPLDVELHAATGTVDMPSYLAEAIEIDALALKGRVETGFDAFEIERATIGSRGAELGGSGRVVWRDGERAVTLDLTATGVHAEDLPAFWPPALGDDARAWVLENIETGRVTEAEVRLDLGEQDFGPAPLPDEAIDGRFAFDGLSVRYIDEMPPIEGASGKAVFDADRMDFGVLGGTNAGVALEGGSVTITGMGKPGRLATQLRVLADAKGSIEDILTLLDHPPLEVAKELAIAPAATAGRAATRIDVRMPLHDEVTGDEAVVLAEAELSDLTIERLPKLGGEITMARGAFDLVVDEAAVRLDGTAEIDDIPLAISVFEPLEDGESKRRIELAGKVSRDQLAARGLVPEALSGAADVKATVTETGTHFWVDFEADLEALAIAPPGLVWSKPEGAPGLLRASIAIPVDGPIEVKQFEIETDDLDAAGSLSLSPSNDGLDTLIFDSFRLAGSDAAMRLSPDGKGGYELAIEGARVDLDALFGEEADIDHGLQRFHAVVRTQQLRARGLDLIDVEADAVRTADGWRSASLIGALPSGGKVALELTPDEADRLLEVRSDDAGALIEAFDLGQRIDGGRLLLSARLKPAGAAVVNGRFEIEDFVLRDAPLLARMLTLASLKGIGNLLGGEGIEIDHLIMPFALQDRRLTFTDGLMRGSQLGLTIKGDVALDEETLDLAGTIIPVYSLNRLIGQVPIIGRILTGVDGRGAFAATYSLEGPRADPVVYVNPLSMLTPGLVRDFFGGLINGTLEPPDIRETDD